MSRPRRRLPAACFFLTPFVSLYLLFFLYPLGRSFWFSFSTTTAAGGPYFSGLRNYRYLSGDWFFWGAVANTAVYVIAFLAVQLPLSLGLAVALNHRRVLWQGLWRFGFYSTGLVGPVFVAVVFGRLLSPGHGPGGIPWLTSPIWARAAVLLAWWWLSVGFGTVYLLAALQGIDHDLYEAASLDGAGAGSRFRHVTWPGVRPAAGLLVLIGLVTGFQLFELPYVLMQGTGPGYAGVTVVTYLFAVAFQQGNLGYASAVGWGLVLIVAGASALQWRSGERFAEAS
jgi:lactose/L-arabinose transport system permease protein